MCKKALRSKRQKLMLGLRDLCYEVSLLPIFSKAYKSMFKLHNMEEALCWTFHFRGPISKPLFVFSKGWWILSLQFRMESFLLWISFLKSWKGQCCVWFILIYVMCVCLFQICVHILLCLCLFLHVQPKARDLQITIHAFCWSYLVRHEYYGENH